MKIAIATKDYRQIAGHAGQSRHWLVYDGTQPAAPPQRIELADAQVFHVHRDGAHPLDGIGVVIAGSAGDGFLRRMHKRGVTVALTAETDPARAQRDWLTGCLAPPAPPGLRGLLCKLRDRLFSTHLRTQ